MTAPFPGPRCCAACGTHCPPGSIRSLSPSHLAVGRPWTLCQQDLTPWWLRARPGSAAFEPSHNWEAPAAPGQDWGNGELHTELACPGRIPPRNQHCLAPSRTRALNFLHSLFWDI